jgi:hypothetical protein
VLWYPTQAKERLEWGTQPLLSLKQSWSSLSIRLPESPAR